MSEESVELPVVAAGENKSDDANGIHVWQWPSARNMSEAELVDVYLRDGRRLPTQVPGAFAFVLRDPLTGMILAARDPVGTRPLYYQVAGDRLRFAFSLAPFADRTGYAADISHRWLAAYLEGIAPPRSTTAFQGVRELLPGEMLTTEAGEVRVSRWHTFESPPERVDDTEAALDSYRAAVYAAADVGDRPAGVELGISLASASLLAAAAHGRPDYDDRLWGLGFANFDRARDLILEGPRRMRLAGADVISGWPGRGTTWSEWYRAGATAVGQPVYHTDLMVQSLLDCLDGSGRSVMLAGGHDSAFGWAFRPGLSRSPADTRRGRRAGAALLRMARGLRASTRWRDRQQPWTPGPFINPSAARDLGLEKLARDESERRARPTGTGYASLTKSGLRSERRERLTTWNQLGRQAGIELVFPLYDPNVLRKLLAMPLDLNELDGHPGGAATSIIGPWAKGPDWAARRWSGTERPKTPGEGSANGTARREYLRDHLHPKIEAILNMDTLGPRLNGVDGSASRTGSTERDRRQASLEFAHIEAANHWLETWSIE